jgi:hypothetical protein
MEREPNNEPEFLKAFAGVSGHCIVWTRENAGEWEKKADKDNIVVNLGRNLLRDNAFASQSSYVQWGAVSDNTTAPAAGDTSLSGNEIRETFQTGYPDTSTNYQAVVQYYIDATQWAGASITAVSKAGLYYAATGSYLFCAASFDAITVNSTTEMLVQWVVQVNDA